MPARRPGRRRVLRADRSRAGNEDRRQARCVARGAARGAWTEGRMMPRIFASLLAGVLTVAAATATAQQPAAAPAATVAERIEAHLAQPRFAGASWGIKAVSLDTGRVLHEHDPDRRLVPASTAKLYTGALALATLGPDHRIATTLLATAKPTRDGNLRGDLILFGYGDPTLGTPEHARWAEELADAAAKAGIRKVEGDLIADATQFAAPSHGGGWEA